MEKCQKVGVHAIIKREDGKFLIVKRSGINHYLPGIWDLPGGEVEFGETPVGALDREILEETELHVSIDRPIFNFTEVQRNERHQFWLLYECKYIEGEIKLSPKEHNEYKWVDLEESKELPKVVFFDALVRRNTI